MRIRLLYLLFVSLVAISCNSDDNDDIRGENTNHFKINSDASALQSSVSVNEAGVLGVTTITSNRSSASVDAPVFNIGIEQIATVEPPSLNQMEMRANHVDVSGNYAYVAYTREGPTYLGGIDIIDISNRYEPRVVSRMTTDNADINALFYRDNKIYFTGAANSDIADRAFIGAVSTINGEFTSDFTLTSIPGYAGVDILPYDGKVVALTGSNGTIGIYNNEDLSLVKEHYYDDLRSAAYANGRLVALSGTLGVLMLNGSTLENENEISIPDLLPESKRTITLKDEKLMVAEGLHGVGVYNSQTGALLVRLPIHTSPEVDIDPNEKVSNAVSYAEGFVLMSNGSAGFGISELDDNNSIAKEGIVEILGSSNYIKSAGDYIFVAAGRGGMRVLKLSKPEAPLNSGIFADCDTYDIYKGGQNFNINSNEEGFYRGPATVKNFNLNNELTFCGSLNIQKSANINSNALFKMNGALAVGSVGSNSHLNINSNSTLQIQGNLTVYGDLNLNGGTLEFIGENSTIHVYGNVRLNSNSNIIGTYTDTSNKL